MFADKDNTGYSSYRLIQNLLCFTVGYERFCNKNRIGLTYPAEQAHPSSCPYNFLGTAAVLMRLVHPCASSNGSADVAAYALLSFLSQDLRSHGHGCMSAGYGIHARHVLPTCWCA